MDMSSKQNQQQRIDPTMRPKQYGSRIVANPFCSSFRRQENASQVPFLYFAKPDSFSTLPLLGKKILDYKNFEPVRASQVAEQLSQHNIGVVALNACQSCFSHNQGLTNMCHMFINSGVPIVLGMSFTVKYDTAEAFYAGFYRSLVLDDEDIHNSSVKGRAEVQNKHRNTNRRQSWPKAVTLIARPRDSTTPFESERPSAAERYHDDANGVAPQQELQPPELPEFKWVDTVGMMLLEAGLLEGDIFVEQPRPDPPLQGYQE